MNRGRLFTIIGGIFGLIGVVVLGVGVALAVSTASFLASAERTGGTVIALTERESPSSDPGPDSAWYPTVEFTVDGRQYTFESSTGASPPAYAEGDPVPVAYDPADPATAQIGSFWPSYFPAVLAGGLGLVFTPVGTGLFVAGTRQLRKRARILAEGREVWAEISHVGVEFSVRLNGRHPYVVHATWHDAATGRTHIATSDYLRDDPGPGLLGRAHVRVLYDPADPDRNVVDLSALR